MLRNRAREGTAGGEREGSESEASGERHGRKLAPRRPAYKSHLVLLFGARRLGAMAPPEPAPAVALRAIEKRFGAVRALRGVDLELRAGEVHGLIGENGAGKSTLLAVLDGALAPDRGHLECGGRPIARLDPSSSRALGIAVVHQHPAVVPGFTILENVLFGAAPGGREWREREPQARRCLEQLGFVASELRRKAGDLSAARRQLLCMARALAAQPRVLVLDEPTAVLPEVEAARLRETVVGLRRDGVAIAYVSHRLEEVESLCDRVTVLRDGAAVGCWRRGERTREEWIRAMVGRDMGENHISQPRPLGAIRCKVSELTAPGVRSVSFEVRAGEILGVGGLVGAGRTELACALFGAVRAESGMVEIDGRPVRAGSVGAAVEAGLALVPEDRRALGVVPDLSIRENVALPSLDRLTRIGWMDRNAEAALATKVISALDVKAGSLETAVATLSGGNQQKVAFGRWLARAPKVWILDEPTQGVDIAGRAEIHDRIRKLAADGAAVLLLSSDLPELLALSDRIGVLRGGRWVATFAGAERTAERVLAAALGQGEAAA